MPEAEFDITSELTLFSLQASDVVKANNLSDTIVVLHSRVEVSSLSCKCLFAPIRLL